MELKTNLHFHTKDDPLDYVPYTTYEGIDAAAQSGFKILALTCHWKFKWTPAYEAYAAQRGITLIPGIELDVFENDGHIGKHVVVLNCASDIEHIRTFDDLARYKLAHPAVFVLAVHPYMYGNFSLHRSLDRHIELFDGVEQSWFYSRRFFNRNIEAAVTAQKHALPFISTSDTHFLYGGHLERNYCVVDAAENTVEAVLDALKKGSFRNVTSPSSFFREMLWYQGVSQVKQFFQNTFGAR